MQNAEPGAADVAPGNLHKEPRRETKIFVQIAESKFFSENPLTTARAYGIIVSELRERRTAESDSDRPTLKKKIKIFFKKGLTKEKICGII